MTVQNGKTGAFKPAGNRDQQSDATPLLIPAGCVHAQLAGQSRELRALAILLALLIPVAAAAQATHPKPPASLQQAVGCILTLPANQEAIRSLGLRLGGTASVRFFVGNIPGILRAPTSWYILIPSPRHTRAWILIADRRANGKFVPMGFDSDRLRRHGGRWEVEEGFGGFHATKP